MQDLKRIAKATGGKILKSLSDMEGEETIDPACLGTAREVVEEKVGDGELTHIRAASQKLPQRLVRGATNSCLMRWTDRCTMH